MSSKKNSNELGSVCPSQEFRADDEDPVRRRLGLTMDDDLGIESTAVLYLPLCGIDIRYFPISITGRPASQVSIFYFEDACRLASRCRRKTLLPLTPSAARYCRIRIRNLRLLILQIPCFTRHNICFKGSRSSIKWRRNSAL